MHVKTLSSDVASFFFFFSFLSITLLPGSKLFFRLSSQAFRVNHVSSVSDRWWRLPTSRCQVKMKSPSYPLVLLPVVTSSHRKTFGIFPSAYGVYIQASTIGEGRIGSVTGHCRLFLRKLLLFLCWLLFTSCLYDLQSFTLWKKM